MIIRSQGMQNFKKRFMNLLLIAFGLAVGKSIIR